MERERCKPALHHCSALFYLNAICLGPFKLCARSHELIFQSVLAFLLCILGALGKWEMGTCDSLGTAEEGWLCPPDITLSSKGFPLCLPLVKPSFSYLYLCVHYIAGAEIFPQGNESN